MGKANLHGHVFGITRTNSIVGQCRNPWNLDRIPGGSSGGSGVAVAAAMSIGALGTDTGGSVRIPASMNGIAGLRPTHGRISLCGITPVSSAHDIPVLEVTGPDPASRRAKGKDDTLDAIAAAEAARTRRRVQVAKDRSGTVEALRVLRTTRKTAIKCRRAALQQLHNTIVAAPEEVRDQVRNLTRMRRLRTCAAWRPDAVGYRDPVVATKLSLKYLARRILDLNDEIAELDRFIVPLVEELAPSLLELEGVGTENAGAVMVAVGGNPDRLRSEASFAMMCGVCPIPASSGKTQRHRLNRGGNRQANSALHMVVVCRMRTDQRTRAYVARRTQEGLSKREVMRCLKRYVAREIYRVLTAPSSA